MVVATVHLALFLENVQLTLFRKRLITFNNKIYLKVVMILVAHHLSILLVIYKK